MNRQTILIFGLCLLIACAAEKDHLITIETRHGTIHAILYDETPRHKENFIELAESGRFDSTDFHRIIPDFMVQGGDVFGKEGLPPDEWYTIPAEFNQNLIHEKGSIAAARQGDGINPEQRSSGSQFYIVLGKVYEPLELTTNMPLLQESFLKYLQLKSNDSIKQQYTELYEQQRFEDMTSMMLGLKDHLESFFSINLNKPIRPNQLEAYTSVGGTPHLDDGYTVFGKVVQGMEVVEKIAAEKTNMQDQPVDPVHMKILVKEMSKQEISEKYGYQYAGTSE